MQFEVRTYTEQLDSWPQAGRVILANYDDRTVVVYQAFRPEIGLFAVRNGFFGGEFKLSRMSWIKPNFLWMMYRSGWASKEDQEVILSVRIKRSAFDWILSQAVPSSFNRQIHDSRESWKRQLAQSEVRLQWDPDHAPDGKPVRRRAIQLGLRGDTLLRYSREWIVEILDVTDFVLEQRQFSISSSYSKLLLPMECVYPVDCPKTRH